MASDTPYVREDLSSRATVYLLTFKVHKCTFNLHALLSSVLLTVKSLAIPLQAWSILVSRRGVHGRG